MTSNALLKTTLTSFVATLTVLNLLPLVFAKPATVAPQKPTPFQYSNAVDLSKDDLNKLSQLMMAPTVSPITKPNNSLDERTSAVASLSGAASQAALASPSRLLGGTVVPKVPSITPSEANQPEEPSGGSAGDSYLMFKEPSQDVVLQFVSRYNQRLSWPLAVEISDAIYDTSAQYGIDPYLLMSVVAVESSFDPFAISKTGAMGLGQLKADTAKWLGVNDPFNPRDNLQGSAKYIRYLLDKFRGRVDLAVAAYYKGQGTIERKGVDDDALYYISKVNKVLMQL